MFRNSMWRKKLVVTSLVTIAGLVVLSGCAGNGAGNGNQAGNKGHLNIAMNLYTRQIPIFHDYVAGAKDAIKGDDSVTLDVVFGEADPNLQFSQIETALNKHPDGMLVVAIDDSSLIPVFQQGFDAGVPLVTISSDLAAPGHAYQLAHVGPAYEDVGKMKAEFLVKALRGKGKIGYVAAVRGNDYTERQRKGALPVFKASPGIEIFDAGYAGGFSSELGLSSAENLLTAHPDLDAIWFDNDDLALGGVTALEQRGGAASDILIVGGDGSTAAIDAIKAGKIAMTVSACSFAAGKKSMEVIRDFLRSGVKPADRVVSTPLLGISAENLEEAIDTIKKGQC